MQRLFSSFANGAPGVGLLLLRIAAAAVLLSEATLGLTRAGLPAQHIEQGLAGTLGLLLFAGLWTPVVAVMVAIAAVAQLLARGQSWQWLLLALIGAALALLGPGAWSIDARLFGRKRVDISEVSGRSPPLE